MRRLVQAAAKAKSLADFDLDSASLAQIVSDAHAAMQAISTYAPRNARGTTFYFQFIAGLRKRLVASGNGWRCTTDGGVEFVENSERKVRIGYLSAEADAGATYDLRSARRRGPSSELIVERNRQVCFDFHSANSTVQKPARVQGVESWFVAVVRAPKGYRLELVLPIECENGRIESWAARILIGDVPFDTEPKLDEVDVPELPQEQPRARRKQPSGDGGSRSGTEG